AVMIVNKMLPFFEALGPFWVLALVYGVVSFLTEMISNNAVALLFTPIALSIADQMGVDARPFVVAVMFGASASFATPIGYQTNTFVYSAGGYKFMDFLKIGTPINILLFLVSVLLIPYFWPF
nr:anion permease [Alphaproteobacteria bacterium]